MSGDNANTLKDSKPLKGLQSEEEEVDLTTTSTSTTVLPIDEDDEEEVLSFNTTLASDGHSANGIRTSNEARGLLGSIVSSLSGGCKY